MDQSSFFVELSPALSRPLVLWVPGVVPEIAVALDRPRVSLEFATEEVVWPWPLLSFFSLP
ncbi:MAG: hypothetical protein DI592_11890 [Stenotrophomonas maltophilia]|uniref:Uncharacterized protein n=1 Tax=Pseudomonas nitroreducens TaxID=46680 RepID=A0A246FF27_PSENT|nr:hypothetical protein CEG18_03435 [Pseudomonas nitroreducens]PZP80740.1 MAG: hypothetical protein DI592_11890 [Stenotrophomonas maltophilia]